MSRLFAVVALLAAALAATAAPTQAAPPSGTAADGPGDVSHFDLARKDCVGTARNRRSKVWYTIADGVLSDVYFPTNDNTNVETLQYVVTDGKTTDLQTRDMTYTVRSLDDRALGCRVVATAKSGRYRITTDYVTDPDRATIAMDSSFKALKGKAADYKLFVRFDPTLNGNGGGQGGQTSAGEEGDNAGADSGSVATDHGHTVLVGSDPVTATIAANRDYAVPVHSALDADRGFRAVSNGFAGKPSDGLTQLDASHSALTSTFANADGGNLVQTAQVDLGHGGDFTLALGFGDSQAKAVGAAHKTLGERFGGLERDYVKTWRRYARKLVAPRRPHGVSRSRWSSLLDEYYLSAFYVKAAEDKTFPGAVAAALASPWGQALSAGSKKRDYFGSYREVFGRDLYEAWTALYLAGDRRTARNMTRFLFERQQLPDGSMPRNSLANGKVAPDSFNTQLDECSYPLIMALAVGLTGRSYYEDHIRPAANFVASHGPSFGPERWEEQSGFSPSTISAEIAGLLAAAKIADRNGDHASAAVWRGVADEFQRNLKTWTLTTNGPLGDGRYFIRLSKNGDPNEAVTYDLGNGGPTPDQRSVIDAGFLEYTRLGLLADDDPDIVRSLPIVDATIRRSTSSGVGFFRYNGDGYGDGLTDGHPWAPTNKGNGHLWPVLAGERGQYEVDRGMTAAALSRLEAMRNMSSGVGLIAEQAWEAPDLAPSPFGTNPATASIGFENGKPAGSASALTWSAGQFVRLTLDAAAGRVLDRPRYTTNRYVRHTQGHTALTVTGPADRTIVSSPVTVTGTSAPGNTIRIAATNTDENSATNVVTGTAGPDGSFAIPVPLIGGRSLLNIVATSPSGATAREARTVVVLAASAPVIFQADDPDGDDHGPGNFQYPTNDAFHSGAFDLEQFQVLDTGDTVTFRVRLRDLSPTFGSPLGAQLLDVYVHDPAASTTSTAAAFASRNHRIGGGGWNKRLEVQGFGQQFVDAGGNTLGTIDIRADDISRYITFRVPRSALGSPGPGWGFVVTLTSQDGFSPDNARSFATTPQPFNLGRCATENSDPHCTVPLDQLPKVMDTLTAPDELDYTAHPTPVTLSPVVVP